MKQFLAFSLLVLVIFGCVYKNEPLMNMMGYDEVSIGKTTSRELVNRYGEPRNIYQKEKGVVVYEYIERLRHGRGGRYLMEVRRYYFVIQEDVVISKTVRTIDPPPYYPSGELLR